MHKYVSTLSKTKVNGEKIELLLCPYMVGDVLITTNEINPNERYKGTSWQKIEDERFLMSASENYPVKSTGGENTHTLTVEEMPSHKHGMTYGYGTGNKTTYNAAVTQKSLSSTYNETEILSIGGGKSHNNIPQFFAVYFWLRIA